jgi:hypothetical protein
VVQRSREGILADNLRQAEVPQFDVEVLVDQQDVLGLDVPVDYVTLVLPRRQYSFGQSTERHTRYLSPFKS